MGENANASHAAENFPPGGGIACFRQLLVACGAAGQLVRDRAYL